MVGVLFVCMGNICRSPTGEGVFRTLVENRGLGEKIRVDSAGTHAYHVGEPPDARAQAVARQRGVELSGQRARQATSADFEQFHYVLAMDRNNYENLLGLCPPGAEDRLKMFLEFAPDLDTREVPDPYYGGGNGFDLVIDMIEAASLGLLDDIQKHHL